MVQEPPTSAGPRDIPDDWLNDYSTYQQCFVCGQHNAHGLKTVYRQDGDRIVIDSNAAGELEFKVAERTAAA